MTVQSGWQPIETVPSDRPILVRGGYWFGEESWAEVTDYKAAVVKGPPEKSGNELRFQLTPTDLYGCWIHGPTEWQDIPE